MDSFKLQPVTLYGSNISYFTGKLENYFKVKGIDYELRSMQMPRQVKQFKREIGLWQMPIIQLADGRWMTDTTKIIEWFENQVPANLIVPPDPLQAFICYLIEDYADEWLWRPAMHYRWHYAEGAMLQSRHLVDELMGELPVPGVLKRWQVRRRQRQGYTVGDGITPASVAGVEQLYRRLLQNMQSIFEQRPFLLGDKPSLADVGLSGPFFRHFALDPVPLEIIRQQAPAVLEWVARLWNTRLADAQGDWIQGIPTDLGSLLDDIGSDYLPYLCANVDAVESGNKRFDVNVGGVDYRGARYSRYRVWCLQQLRSRFDEIPDESKQQAQQLLEQHSCWEPLWRQPNLPLLPGQEEGLPFRASTKMVGVNE